MEKQLEMFEGEPLEGEIPYVGRSEFEDRPTLQRGGITWFSETGVQVEFSDPEFKVLNKNDMETAMLHVNDAQSWLDMEVAKKKKIVERLDSVIKRRQGYVDYVKSKCIGIQEYVEQETAGKKTKSVSTPYGLAGFRAAPASLHVKPDFGEEAAEYLRAIGCADRVTTEVVTRFNLKGIDGKECPHQFFDYTPSTDGFYFRAGLKKEAE